MPRKAAPWYRKALSRWYVNLNGRQTPLSVTDPADVAGAWSAFQTLLGKATASNLSVRPGTIAENVPAYLEAMAARATPKTIRGYAVYLRRLNARFGEKCIGDISADAVEKRATQEGWSDSNRANYLWTVQAFVRWCGRKDFTLHRPAKDSRGAEAVIDENTHRLILRETTGDFHELCRLLWAIGCRPMEAALLTADSIDWASGTVTLRQHKTRHKGKRRILYLSSEAIGILRAQAERHPSGPLFVGQRGKAFTPKAIVCRMLRVSEKIGRDIIAYGYRHGFATRALAAGIPDVQVAALMGHTSTAMIYRHYGHIHSNARLLREVAEKISDQNRKSA